MKTLTASFFILFACSTHAFDLERFERDLDNAIERASISTDLRFSCSEKGREATAKLIESIKETSLRLPVRDAEKIAINLEKEYKKVFNCEERIKEALKLGFTNDEIQAAIKRNSDDSGKEGSTGSIDWKTFERELQEAADRV